MKSSMKFMLLLLYKYLKFLSLHIGHPILVWYIKVYRCHREILN